MIAPEARVATPSVALRWAPLPLLVVSTALGWLTTPELLDPDRMRLSLLPTVLLLIIRVVVELLHDRLRVAGPAVLGGYLLHAVVLVAGVALNPFLCIYAFFGYIDVDRFLSERLAVPGVVLTGVTCGFGQSGGLPGVTASPTLFAVLAGVNIALALTMLWVVQSREREVEAREQAIEELTRVHQQNVVLQEQLLQQAHETGIAEERARLSRELHDTVAQGLVGVIRQLESLPGELAPEVRLRIDRAEMTARDCLTETRRAVRALGPQQLQDANLVDAVRAVVENWSLTNDIAAEVRVDGVPPSSCADAANPRGCADDVVLRVVQEALANVSRHAGARSVTVTLSWLDDELIVDICDDGNGFDPAAVVRGRGLDGMAERLRAADGRLVVESTAGEGTTVVAVVPQ